jgi:hypothetical protein
MRNTMKTLAALLIVLSAAKSNAHTDSTSVVTYCKVVAQEKEGSYTLIYQAYKKADVSIKWIDSDDHVVHSERLKSSESFVKKYDLATLPDGMYTLKVVADDYEYTKEVTVGGAENVKVAVRSLGKKKVLLTSIPISNSKMYLAVYNDKAELIYEENIKDASAFQKKFGFDNVDTKSVTFMIFSDYKIVSEEKITF